MNRELEAKFEREEELQNIEIILNYAKNEKRSELKDFGDIYSAEEIKRDARHLKLAEERIERLKSEMSPEERMIAEINEKRGLGLEGTLEYGIYHYEWLGHAGIPVRTSRFDDVIGGVDMIVEFDMEDIERMALAVDASTASDIGVMEKKIKRNIRRVTDDFWPLEVKYFESQTTDENGDYFKGKLENLIPVVIGADKYNANRIFETLSELIFLKDKEGEEAKDRRQWLKKKFYHHPIQRVFFDQINTQLEMYKYLLEKENKSSKEVDKLLEIISEASKEKEKAGFSSPEEINGDKTLDNIKLISKKYTCD